MIGIIDYDIGNLRSVQKAFQFVAEKGTEIRFLKKAAELSECDGIVLPGVGNFGDCVRALRASGMCEAAMDWAKSGRPFFGICVGMQMLFERSEEDPGAPGLGLFAGSVKRFDAKHGLKIPQIGWNTLEVATDAGLLLKDVETGAYAYFVHSYYVEPVDPALVALQCTYGQTFAAGIIQGSLIATQFHPEKSQKAGLQLIKNFLLVVERDKGVEIQGS